jgi:hypothetical protein
MVSFTLKTLQALHARTTCSSPAPSVWVFSLGYLTGLSLQWRRAVHFPEGGLHPSLHASLPPAHTLNYFEGSLWGQGFPVIAIWVYKRHPVDRKPLETWVWLQEAAS